MDGCGFGFATGDRVCVAEGRHFQDFAAGDVGVVSDADHSAQTCQVIFRHRPHDKLRVAWRHLRKCGDEPPSFQSRNATSKEDFATLDRANLSNQDGLAKDLGHALGAASMAGYWEAALTHLESGPSSSPGLGDWVREFPDEGEASLSAAVEASASARASSFATALLEAQTASSKVKELEEKFAQHSREHWLGLECLQERMSGTASQREVHELKQSFQKELAAVGKHVHGLSDQYQAITDLVASVRKELGYKASHEQLEDLEHQQCKAMESLLHRWDRCAESRRRALETEAGKALGEVQWQAAKPEKEEVRIAEEHVTRLDMLCREQTAVKQQLARLQTDVKVGNASRSLEGHDTPDWEHRFRLLSVKVDGLCSQLEVVQSTCSAADARATKERCSMPCGSGQMPPPRAWLQRCASVRRRCSGWRCSCGAPSATWTLPWTPCEATSRSSSMQPFRRCEVRRLGHSRIGKKSSKGDRTGPDWLLLGASRCRRVPCPVFGRTPRIRCAATSVRWRRCGPSCFARSKPC
ncbi:unnamed protein product [Effrenium voratum]|nr:unnamed protein product [Effrenium voratum]